MLSIKSNKYIFDISRSIRNLMFDHINNSDHWYLKFFQDSDLFLNVFDKLQVLWDGVIYSINYIYLIIKYLNRINILSALFESLVFKIIIAIHTGLR